VKVFRKETTREFPHLEGIPDPLGFTYWWVGEMHPLIGRFSATHDTTVSARLVGGEWDEIGWFVVEIEGERIAEGRGTWVELSVRAGRDHYLTAYVPDHPFTEYALSVPDTPSNRVTLIRRGARGHV
jgi:hypothetical protein